MSRAQNAAKMESVKQFEEVTVYVLANDSGGVLTTGRQGIIINPVLEPPNISRSHLTPDTLIARGRKSALQGDKSTWEYKARADRGRLKVFRANSTIPVYDNLAFDFTLWTAKNPTSWEKMVS